MKIYDQLRNSGQAFIYVFIHPKANLNATIMAKRAQQLARLQEMYTNDGTYSPAQMIDIIREGIKAKYNRTPEQILTILLFNYGSKVNGIGEITGSHFDGTNWVDDASGEVLAESASVLATTDASGNITSNFWTDVQGVIEFIVSILSALGITKPTSTIGNNVPEQSDWANLNDGSNISGADFSTYLPWVVGAAIVVTLFTGKNKLVSKTKTK